MNRALAKRPYFESRADQRQFLSLVAREVRAGRLEVHAYCLMTTHFHLFVRSPGGGLSEAMRQIQFRYAQYFNRVRCRDGPLVRGRFVSKRADTGDYRRAIVRYIDVNPARAGLAATAADHEFGSARAHLGQRRPPWLATDWIEEQLAERAAGESSPERAYLRVFGAIDADDVEALCSFVEARLASRAEEDPLEDLIGSTPATVRRWLERNAHLADGHAVGLPVCGPVGVVRSVAADTARRGDWSVEGNGQSWCGSELALVGLLRTLCAAAWPATAQLAETTVDRARRRAREHRRALESDPRHVERVARIAAAAVARSVGIAGSGAVAGEALALPWVETAQGA